MKRPDPRLYKPTDSERRLVKHLKILGCTDVQVSELLQISHVTFAKHFNREKREAKMFFLSEAIGVLAHHLKKNNLAAAIFTLKTQAGWREVGAEKVDDKDTLPTYKIDVHVPDRRRGEFERKEA